MDDFSGAYLLDDPMSKAGFSIVENVRDIFPERKAGVKNGHLTVSTLHI